MNSILRSPGPEDSAPITLPEETAALEEMAEQKAAGPDGLHLRLLRMLLPVEVCRDLIEMQFSFDCCSAVLACG